MHLLVTGGAGFIGANFIALAIERGHRITNLDALTYAANLNNCREFASNDNCQFIHGNICDRELVNSLFERSNFDAVLNIAAETHVDRSIAQAHLFTETNVLGTVTLLEAAQRYLTKCFVQISTDEVYGSLGPTGKFTLDSPLRPSSAYSASKAAADLMALSFYHTHGMDVRVTRCTNNFGRFQNLEKFIPTIITNALDEKPIPVYGDGKYIRDWIHVDDHSRGLLATLEHGMPGELYHFGGSTEIENNELVRIVLAEIAIQTGRSESELAALSKHVKDRPGHDRRYALDWTGSSARLGWKPQSNFTDAIAETVKWYRANRDWWTAA